VAISELLATITVWTLKAGLNTVVTDYKKSNYHVVCFSVSLLARRLYRHRLQWVDSATDFGGDSAKPCRLYRQSFAHPTRFFVAAFGNDFYQLPGAEFLNIFKHIDKGFFCGESVKSRLLR